jgi:hypothetical protein
VHAARTAPADTAVASVRCALALAAAPQQQQQQQRELVLAAPCLPLRALQSLLLRPDIALHSCSSTSSSSTVKTASFKSWLSFSKQEAEAVAALALAGYAAALTATATATTATAAIGTATAAGEVSHELANSDWSALLLAVCDATVVAAADDSTSSVHNTEGAVRVLLHQLNSADASTGSTPAAAADDSMEVVADGAR